MAQRSLVGVEFIGQSTHLEPDAKRAHGRLRGALFASKPHEPGHHGQKLPPCAAI